MEHNCLYHDMDKSMMIWLQKEETKEVKLARDMLSPLQPMSVTRIVRHYYELMDKITVFDAGFDDFEMELFKFGVCIRENIDLTTPFYFTELESPFLGRKKLLFLL